LRRLRAFWEVPATPWTRERCAPSAAGRENVLPHSGHVSWLTFVAFDAAVRAEVVRLRVAGLEVAMLIRSLVVGVRTSPSVHHHIVRIDDGCSCAEATTC
jgi:hypothetical protein